MSLELILIKNWPQQLHGLNRCLCIYIVLKVLQRYKLIHISEIIIKRDLLIKSGTSVIKN